MPNIDLLASRLFHQLGQYFAWKNDPSNQGIYALQQISSFMHFPHFALFYKSWGKSVPTKQEKRCLSHQNDSLKSVPRFY